MVPMVVKKGRPTEYKAEYVEQAYKLCLLGHTDKELGGFFGVTETTINNWKFAHPEFFEAITNGKEVADAEVAASLYQRAKGYSHPEDKIFQYAGDPIIVPTIKHYPPDTAAAFIWLKNRQKGKWRDTQQHEITGKDGGPIETKPVGAMSAEERRAEIKELVAELEE